MKTEEEMIKIPLSEAKEMFFLLEELHSFLHQPRNYDHCEKVESFAAGGCYARLKKAYYEVVWNWLPERTQEEIEDR